MGRVQGKEVTVNKSREVGGEANVAVSLEVQGFGGGTFIFRRCQGKKKGGKAFADPYKGGK